MKHLDLLLFTLFCSFTFLLPAQNNLITLSGNVIDPDEMAVEFANVVLYQTIDSSMVKIAQTMEAERFEMPVLKAGQYWMEVSYVGLAAYRSKILTLVAGQNLDVGVDLGAYLGTLQSTDIDAIEIITNPSAKYDAEGNAGIINIRLIKNKSLGGNASLNAAYAVGKTDPFTLGFNGNYRNKRMNFFGNYSYTDGNNNRYNFRLLQFIIHLGRQFKNNPYVVGRCRFSA